LRVLGVHPRDRQPVELHAGRYGPYVKHGTTNATLPDRDAIDSLSLEQAVALVDEKAGRAPTPAVRKATKARAPRTSREAAASTGSSDIAVAPPRRVVPPRGARRTQAVAHAAAVSRTPTRAPAQKRTPSAKATAATRGNTPAAKTAAAARGSTPSAKTKPAAARTTVAGKRGASKAAPADGKGTSSTMSTTKRSATSMAARKSPAVRKPAAPRKGKRR
jgi:hypothetical protein